MANPVTYNSGNSIAGSLKSSVISVGISTSLNISGYNWRNGFENNNIWVIYSDTYSQGQSTQGNAVPTIWGTPIFTEAGLLNLINVLPARAGQTAFTTLSSAISWLYSENKYFLSNQNYPPIVSSDLSLFLDAGFTASYPNVGTTWYDLSGNDKNFTLVNGPSWNNTYTKSNFSLDGTDDAINRASSVLTTSTGTVILWLRTTDTQWLWVRGNNNNGFYLGAVAGGSGWYNSSCGSPSYFVDTVSSTNPVSEGVLDGRYRMFEAKNVDFSSWTNYEILAYPTFYMNGNVSKILMYNRNITSDESSQLYYQGNIVTTNLSYLWDASNIISYYSGLSTTYDLLKTGVNGTLQNGVGYSGNFGGYWSFDGTDDRILLSSSVTLGNGDTNWTVNAWIRTTALDNGLTANPILSNTNGGPIYGSFDTTQGYQTYWAYPSNINNWKQFQGSIFVSDGEWHMLTYVNKSDYTMDFYVDGVYDKTVSPTNVSNNNPLDVIGGGLGTSFDGSIGMVQVNKGIAMNASQVSQQYGATKGKFQSFGALAQGGTETTITQDGISYKVHTFTSSGSLTIVKGGSVEVLVVAGGGSGGGSTAGGGGAGGLIYDNSYYVNDGQTITATIGAGGNGVGPITVGNDGNNSVFGDITATGGGGGGMTTGGSGAIGRNGGSGGGGSWYSSINFRTPGSGIAGQGYDGGDGGTGDRDRFPSGGGGGAGGKGGDATNTKSGNGGIGQPYGLTGTTVYYAGGGGGGSQSNGGNGGLGGGAAGTSNGNAGATATANTGGGGGGGWLYCCGSGGAGGSGLIIVRYPIF
jgi:hypothetical protein